MNMVVSFVTNTNWQSYGGETTMSYLTQMAGLAVWNFLSPAVAMAALIALVRGLVRRQASSIGNFWVDLTRSVLWVLLPLAIVLALAFASQGVIQNLHPYVTAQTLEGAQHTIAVGPVASQEAIKDLGTNGGGFFNVNFAHPFENPSPVTNLLTMLAIMLIPAGLAFNMFVGRFGVLIPMLAIAGTMVKKQSVPSGPGTFQTTGPSRPLAPSLPCC